MNSKIEKYIEKFFVGKGSKLAAIDTMKCDERLYAFDRHIGGNKAFFNATQKEISKLLKNNLNIYEHFGYDDKSIKLFLDIDYNLDKNNEYDSKDDLLNDFFASFNDYLLSYNLNNGCVVLDSSDEINKYSFHLIYNEIIFNNISNMKQFIEQFNKISNNKFYVDISVYRNGCLRCVNQSKLCCDRIFKNYYDTKIHIRDTLVTNFDENKEIFVFENKDELMGETRKIMNIDELMTLNMDDEHKINYSKFFESLKTNPEIMDEMLEMLEPKYCDNYDNWFKIVMSLKCNNDNRFREQFDNFSKKSSKYDDNSLKIFDNFIARRNGIYNYSSILYFIKEADITKYEDLCDKYKFFFTCDEKEIKIENTLTINQNYLLPEQKLTNDDLSKTIKNYLRNNNKCLIIKSVYNTGKTSLLKEIENSFERVLFVSYRVTLTYDLSGNFSSFHNYKNKTVNVNDVDKLIIQYDSLIKLHNLNYDLIILDEIESLINHMSASTIKEQKKLFDIFYSILHNGKKIIMLDGAISNKTKRLALNLDNKTVMINNLCIKDKRHFIFTKNEDKVKQLIQTDLNNNQNICIVCQSAETVEELAEIFKYKIINGEEKDIKRIWYTRMSSDHDKADLVDVKGVWVNYQLVIYNGTIESGLNFDIEHFDKIYMFLKGNLCSQDGVFQQLSRIRKLKESTIYVHCDKNLRFTDEKTRKTNINEIILYYKNVVNKLNEMNNYKLMINNEGQLEYARLSYDNMYNIYDILMMYNIVTDNNKTNNRFLPIFIEMLLRKGHTYTLDEEEIIKVVEEKIIDKEQIIKISVKINKEYIESSKLINFDAFKKLINKQNKNELTKEEQNNINKMLPEFNKILLKKGHNYIVENNEENNEDDKDITFKINININKESMEIIKNKLPNADSIITLKKLLNYNNLSKDDKNKIEHFLPTFVQIILINGDTYSLISNIIKNELKINIKINKENIETIKDKIVNAESIDIIAFKKLLLKQSNSTLTKDDKFKIEKFMYENSFNIRFNEIDEATKKIIMGKFYNKYYVVKLCKKLLNGLEKDKVYEDSTLMNAEKILKMKQFKQLLNILDCKPNEIFNEPKIYTKEKLESLVPIVNDFFNENKQISSNKKINIYDTKTLITTINAYIVNYGMVLNINESKTKRINGSPKLISDYKISFYDFIKDKIDIDRECEEMETL